VVLRGQVGLQVHQEVQEQVVLQVHQEHQLRLREQQMLLQNLQVLQQSEIQVLLMMELISN
jgi:hypothetical protein